MFFLFLFLFCVQYEYFVKLMQFFLSIFIVELLLFAIFLSPPPPPPSSLSSFSSFIIHICFSYSSIHLFVFLYLCASVFPSDYSSHHLSSKHSYTPPYILHLWNSASSFYLRTIRFAIRLSYFSQDRMESRIQLGSGWRVGWLLCSECRVDTRFCVGHFLGFFFADDIPPPPRKCFFQLMLRWCFFPHLTAG